MARAARADRRFDHEPRAVEGIGLTDVERDAVVTLIAGHVEGAARRALESRLAEQRIGVSDREWWEQRAPSGHASST